MEAGCVRVRGSVKHSADTNPKNDMRTRTDGGGGRSSDVRTREKISASQAIFDDFDHISTAFPPIFTEFDHFLTR